MSNDNDRGSGLFFFVGIYTDIPLFPILFIALLPLGVLFSSFLLLAELFTDHFILSSIVYHVIALGVSIWVTRLKNISRFCFMDYISNFLMFLAFYLFTYFYFVPLFIIRGAILSWIIGSAFIVFIVFLQQCFSRIIHPVINFLICSVMFVISVFLLRVSISDSNISSDFLLSVYRINENRFLRSFIEILLY